MFEEILNRFNFKILIISQICRVKNNLWRSTALLQKHIFLSWLPECKHFYFYLYSAIKPLISTAFNHAEGLAETGCFISAIDPSPMGLAVSCSFMI